ncbi:hypothetical protein IMG5_194690 [Ichthyophthirius multifiliis]|uniref:Transmembrane 9 superfamily member n=1 Tax=Ichthyophthirius multifiliis TaxID=5932 RepID=G0R4T2_ICHMU|nr:hypothetical protein IMG5_194690 [Ichthyophthirius multifiliis]EGR27520.1 hypothetical protein IMG5_194690 [Ichthyophthirius multifiliis]|eukprot:XP_004024972.1 hypothetical protein IMG5_194690 [Ichthyophthirius multifiliis]
MKVFIFFLLFLLIIIRSFNIPGFSENSYNKNSILEVLVSEVKSLETQLPYKYNEFDFCDAYQRQDIDESIAEALLGENKQVSQIQFQVFQFNLNYFILRNNYFILQHNQIQVKVFQKNHWKEFLLDFIMLQIFIYSINNFYFIQINKKKEQNEFYLYNHFDFTVIYYQDSFEKYKIAVFQVIPSSQGAFDYKTPFCQIQKNDQIVQKQDLKNIFYTYSVKYIMDNTKSITSRWERYRNQEDLENHQGTLINSFTVNLALALLIYCILRRILMKDLSQYSQLQHQETDNDEMGWKQLKSDVFRAPGNPIVLSTFVGVGLQLGTIIILSIVFIAIQYNFEKYRTSSFLNVLIIFYIISGFISGYYSARIYKMLGGCYWLRSTILTTIIFPGIISFIYFIIEFAMFLEESLYTIRFKTIFQLFFFWFLVQIPLVFFGSVLGFKRQKIQQICRINPVPMPIPKQYIFLSRHMLCIIGGLLPFGCILFELTYIVKSIWNNQFFYLFGFLLLAVLLLIITCAEISILLTYVQLNNGNHKWWWNSFYSTGFCGVYVYAYCFFYWLFYLNITRLSSTIMYFGTMAIGSIAMFLFCGSVGFVSSCLFTRYIYAQIKAD